MQVKCDYCGGYIEDSDEFCSHCGAVNSYFKRSTDGTPKTIEELKAWYRAKNLPSEDITRFFIGKNYQGAKAIGIYEENGEYIVYKNKDDGTRAVRYQGKDEAYAVNEVYLKLKSEILNQKAHNINNRNGATNVNNPYRNNNNIQTKGKSFTPNFKILILFLSMFLGLVVTMFLMLGSLSRDTGFSNEVENTTTTDSSFTDGLNEDSSNSDSSYSGGYYSYDDNVYYCDSYADNRWYIYDPDFRDYSPVEVPQQMYDDIQSYRYEDNEEWDSSIERFEDTETGQLVESEKEDSISDSSSSSDSDSNYSWDSSDSWDSDYSDWGSDWDSDW